MSLPSSAAGAAGGGGLWGGRGGAPNGAQFQTRHDRDAAEPIGFTSQAFGSVAHRDAAGAPSGARYEVVHRHRSASHQQTAPFANDSEAWRRSVAHYPGQLRGPAPQAMMREDHARFDSERHGAAGPGVTGYFDGPGSRGSTASGGSGPLRAAAAAAIGGGTGWYG
eukprot:TRINITY_DN28520_c0_g1_i1.p1 TRINITY_DN28520_c0_g1~~TRINITY_DN28520_c0_g1_i1.p1  ORF type:complete len:180 (+),score=30.12 TRINITY_DN28520_c0_g1_i1:44-541(+)